MCIRLNWHRGSYTIYKYFYSFQKTIDFHTQALKRLWTVSSCSWHYFKDLKFRYTTFYCLIICITSNVLCGHSILYPYITVLHDFLCFFAPLIFLNSASELVCFNLKLCRLICSFLLSNS